LNWVEDQEYVRVWAQNQFDGEYIALDIAFPYSNHVNDDDATKEEEDKKHQQHVNADDERKQKMFIHDLTKPVYLLLHGLNGGSQEEFIKDMVRRRREEGSTVVVMIARGMMDTHLVTWNTFHGARTGDVDAAARVLRKGLTSLADAHNIRKRQILAGVGYSTGESVSSLVSFYVFMLMGLLIACIQKRLFDFETSVAEKPKFSFD
jgi:predicted alpha/beta-fold hydrolase